MMKMIKCHSVPVDGPPEGNKVVWTYGSQVMHVGMIDHRTVGVWEEHPGDAAPTPVNLIVWPSQGAPVPSGYLHVGSTQDGPLTWHVYSVG